jgi:hypothetical protein
VLIRYRIESSFVTELVRYLVPEVEMLEVNPLLSSSVLVGVGNAKLPSSVLEKVEWFKTILIFVPNAVM